MTKKRIKKLALNRESILCLDPADLQGVAGGKPTNMTTCSNIVACTTDTQNCTKASCSC